NADCEDCQRRTHFYSTLLLRRNSRANIHTLTALPALQISESVGIEIIFSLTLAISYEVSVHVLLRWVSVKRVYH
ncbi:hypothetical protein MJN69_29130, partial [Salmonella enterica subsp. enterica serovar Kentucky]|nr:hypothetical protein [Salmonella enterica subsp. enterica serovar Kentucky]